MRLYAETNIVGSASSCSLGISKAEWDNMSIYEQEQTIREHLGDIVDTWVEEGEN